MVWNSALINAVDTASTVPFVSYTAHGRGLPLRLSSKTLTNGIFSGGGLDSH